jgi:outer membrane protein
MNSRGFAWRAVLAVALLATTGLAQAQGIKVGVISFGRLLDEAPQAVASQRALQEEFAPRQRDLRAREEELKTMAQRLQEGEGFMGEEERRNLERDARDTQRELDRSKSEFAEDLSLRRNEELGRLQRMLVTEVQAFAQNESYDVIISEAAGVVYASNAVDITERILETLRAKNTAGN